MHAFNDLSLSHWALKYPGRTPWHYTSIWPNRVEHTEGFACVVQKTMAEQRLKKIKDAIKKSEELWVFTLYSRKKYKKKQFAALLGLCPHNELQYDCELAENAHGFFILMDSWNSTRGWMQYEIWCVCYHDLMRGWTDGSPAVKRSD